MSEHPNVFISYSQDSAEHMQWVNRLGTNLRHHGVNAILDQWDLRLGSDLRFFMEQGLSESSLVLCICSENYVEKINSGRGGAGYEGMIMTQDLLSNANQDHIICVVRNNSSEHKVPRAFGSKLYIDFSEDRQYYVKYQELIERIYGEDVKRKPLLGESPFSDSLAQKIMLKTQIESLQYTSPSFDGNVSFCYNNNNGDYLLGSGEYSFLTHWSGCSIDAIYSYGHVGYKKGATGYPAYCDIEQFDFTSKTRTIRQGEIVVIQNSHNHFVAIKMGHVTSTSHGQEDDVMEFEYHIYGDIK